ncbi:MAG: chemotaxis protein CheW [Crocosphaera sp.]|nr:chemotaxis protein CheW [Crocosphaera sp.]
MNTKSYLIFNLHDIQYGIEVNLVKEIFLLPELIPITEAPTDIIGILNLREKLLPVMHLDLRLGNPLTRCQISDSIIVLDYDNLQIGVIVTAVHEVQEISSDMMEKDIDYGRSKGINPLFMLGIAKIDGNAIILLNPEALIREPNQVKNLSEASDNKKIINSFYDLCCPNATLKERSIFRRRAEYIQQPILENITEKTEEIILAIVSLNGEYFGLDLQTVREFINIGDLTRIPCCPEHILGNINLRGEIVTLVNLRTCLNLPTNSEKTISKAVVVEVDDLVAALPIDQVFDVMYLPQKNINPVPIAIESGKQNYVLGTASYAQKIFSILDLSKIFLQGNLEVNEAA